MKNHNLTVILTPILMIFYSYTPWPYTNTLNQLDLQFKIFTLVDTTKSYVILNITNKLLSVSESIILMGYAFYETNFHDPTVKHICIYFENTYAKNCKQQTFRDQVTGQNFSTIINKKSRFNSYFNSDFDDFLRLHSFSQYEYKELIWSSI